MFGLNNAQIIGRLGADATVSHLTSGGRVANVSVATDESYMDRNSGDKVDRTEWHRIVTFQDGLVDMLEKHAKKGRLVYVSGKLQTRKWRKDGEDSDRYSTEILLVPGGRVQSSTSRTATQRRRPTAPPLLPPPGPPRRWTTATFLSRRPFQAGFLPPAISGPVPATKARDRPCFHAVRFPALRFHPDLLHRDDTGVRRLPALVAAVTGLDGAIDGVQRTWLDPDRPAKADLARPRKALGRVHGRAVRFGALHFDGMRFGAVTGATLLAGEGIETVLSLVTAVPGIDAAAALSAGSLGAFQPPPGLARLIVARDNDAEGERAFQRLERRCAARRIATIAIVSDLGDFNDDLVAFGAETLAARIGPLFAPGVASPTATVPPMATPETRNGGELGSVPA